MVIAIKRSICEHLPESKYNHNYYRMPVTVDGYDTVLELGDDDQTVDYYLGKGIFTKAEGVFYGYDFGNRVFKDEMHLDSEEINKLYT